MKKVISINIKYLFYITCIGLISCDRKQECFYKGDNKAFCSFNVLKSTLERKDIIKIYEIVDSSVVSTIFSMTDSLNSPNQFGLIKECSKGLFFKSTSDSTFNLSVGEVHPILGFSGGSYNFIKRKNKLNYVLFEIIQLE